MTEILNELRKHSSSFMLSLLRVSLKLSLSSLPYLSPSPFIARTMATATHEYWVDMSCGSCSKAVNTLVGKVPGVKEINIDLNNKKVIISGTASESAIEEAIKKTGKKMEKWDTHQKQ